MRWAERVDYQSHYNQKGIACTGPKPFVMRELFNLIGEVWRGLGVGRRMGGSSINNEFTFRLWLECRRLLLVCSFVVCLRLWAPLVARP